MQFSSVAETKNYFGIFLKKVAMQINIVSDFSNKTSALKEEFFSKEKCF